MTPADRSDMINSLMLRNEQAKAILEILLMAMQSDSPPAGDIVDSAISAATSILSN